jgi:hypothetical protein
MKKDMDNYIAKCMECQKVKIEHKHPARLLHPLPISEWKWEVVTIDFSIKFPIIARQHNSMMVVVDNITKATHSILMKTTHKVTNIAEIYMKEVVGLYGVPKEIVSDKDPNFNSKFLKIFFNGFWNKLNFSTTYHPESNEKTNRTNRIIEDMLRM